MRTLECVRGVLLGTWACCALEVSALYISLTNHTLTLKHNSVCDIPINNDLNNHSLVWSSYAVIQMIYQFYNIIVYMLYTIFNVLYMNLTTIHTFIYDIHQHSVDSLPLCYLVVERRFWFVPESVRRVSILASVVRYHFGTSFLHIRDNLLNRGNNKYVIVATHSTSYTWRNT